MARKSTKKVVSASEIHEEKTVNEKEIVPNDMALEDSQSVVEDMISENMIEQHFDLNMLQTVSATGTVKKGEYVQELKEPEKPNSIIIISKVGILQAGTIVPIDRVDDNKNVYFTIGDLYMHLTPQEHGRLWKYAGEK